MLIVEDDDLSIIVMRKIFQDEFEITVCDSAEKFYEEYKNNFDIIIMDVSLRGARNGFELIKEIKELPSYTGTPIICFTAHADMKARKNAMESGSDLFISKPVSNSALKEAVNSLIR